MSAKICKTGARRGLLNRVASSGAPTTKTAATTNASGTAVVNAENSAPRLSAGSSYRGQYRAIPSFNPRTMIVLEIEATAIPSATPP